MKKKNYKKQIWLLLWVLVLIAIPIMKISATEKTKLNSKKITVYVGEEKKLKLEHNKKKVNWSVISGKKTIALKQKSKQGVTIVGKKAGTAKVSAQIGKKKFICSVTIKKTKSTTEQEIKKEDKKLLDIQIEVGDNIFYAKLYNNETTQAFIKQMPITLNMNELNGNEKYYYFSESLPTKIEKTSDVQKGDIMLFGSDCLVLFYEDLSTSYQYIRLGYIEDTFGLAAALGNGTAKITFKLV